MKKLILFIVFFLILVLSAGCSSGGDAAIRISADDRQEAHSAALVFVLEQGWDDLLAEESWETSAVRKVHLSEPEEYVLLEKRRQGKPVWSVSFQARKKGAEVPAILVDSKENTVIGYKADNQLNK